MCLHKATKKSQNLSNLRVSPFRDFGTIYIVGNYLSAQSFPQIWATSHAANKLPLTADYDHFCLFKNKVLLEGLKYHPHRIKIISSMSITISISMRTKWPNIRMSNCQYHDVPVRFPISSQSSRIVASDWLRSCD